MRSNIFKAKVEEYLRLASQPGQEAGAQAVKDSMPCIVPAGVCLGGHAVKNLVRHSGLLQVDIDHTCLRTSEVCGLLRELPYVVVAHKSFSQSGVRAFVRVSPADVERCYEQLYAAVGQAVSLHTGHAYDPKCKILTQPSFYSWDAGAYYNPDAVPFPMRWDGAEEQQATVPVVPSGMPGTVSETVPGTAGANANTGQDKTGNGVVSNFKTDAGNGAVSNFKTDAGNGAVSNHKTDAGNGTVSNHKTDAGNGAVNNHKTNAVNGTVSNHMTDAGNGAASNHKTDAVNGTVNNPKTDTVNGAVSNHKTDAINGAVNNPQTGTVTNTAAPGFLISFLNDFEHRNPFRRGERNDLALKLGRVARSKGFSLQELENITTLFALRYAASDFTAVDIHKRIIAGYQFVSSNPPQPKETNKVQNSVQVPYAPSEHPLDEGEEEDLLEKNNELRAQSPYISDNVYKQLPLLLQECVQYATDPRERDIILLSSLNCCSALFPGVSFFYKNSLYSPHFYLAVVAAAGAGKGVMAFTYNLLDATQDYYDTQRREQKRTFIKEQAKWENEVHQAQREHRAPDVAKKPEEPKGKYLKTAATTSKSRLLEQLATNGELGCHMASTEINTLVSSLTQDYGRYEDIFCKAAHHEEISQSYKTDGDPIVVRHPHLALAISGTQEQFLQFFHSHENGLYSRFLIYTRQTSLCWEICSPGAERVDLRTHFRDIGKKLFEMHKLLLESPTLVTFTPEQWERHTQRFSCWLQSALVEGRESTSSIIFRHGLLAMRLAAILTLFRKWDDYRYAKEYCCTDTDFDTAMQIVTAVLEHSLLLGTTLPDTGQAPVAMRYFHRFDRVLAGLPRKFSYTEFIEAAQNFGMSLSTAKRILKKGLEYELIVKQEDRYRKRNKRRGKEGQ